MINAVYEAGLSMTVYYMFHVLGYLGVLLFNMWYGKKYLIPIWKSILTTIIVYAITYGWIYVQFWIESGFKNFGGNNIVRGFVYIPLIALPVAFFLKIKWKTMCDFIAPCVCISHGISHIGCIFAGCCEGYESTWGIFNPFAGKILFPIQLFEAVTALLIVFVVTYRAYKKKYVSDGLSFPIMILLFGFTRFTWEFARNNEKILWGCSSLAFHALFMGIVGLVIIIIDRTKKQRKGVKRK